MNADVVLLGLDPVDLDDRDSDDLGTLIDPEVADVGRIGLRDPLAQARQLQLELCQPPGRGAGLEMGAGLVQRGDEPLGHNRLEHKVGGANGEGASRITVEGGDEDDHRCNRRRKLLEQLETAEAGHFNVEQKHVGADERDAFKGNSWVNGV